MEANFILYIILVIIAFVLGVWNRKDYPSFAKQITGLLLLTLMVELAKIEWPNFKELFMSIYYFGEIIFLGFSYYHVIKSKNVKKNIRILLYIIALSYLALNLFNDTGSNTVIMLSVNHVYFLIIGIIYVFETYLPPFKEGKLIRNPFFWINTANLFFFSGLFLQISLDSYIKSFSIELSDKLHIINEVVNYIYYSLFILGFTCKKIFK